MGLRHRRLARTWGLYAGILLDRQRARFNRWRQATRRVRRPHAAERSFFYGVNFELSFNARYWEPTRNTGEIRPIIGARIGPVDLITNPILDTSFQGLGSLNFAPASRIAYNFSESWAAAVEHYADFGGLSHFEPLTRQYQTLFAVIDYRGEPVNVEFGIGHGFTAASDALIIKLIVSRNF